MAIIDAGDVEVSLIELGTEQVEVMFDDWPSSLVESVDEPI